MKIKKIYIFLTLFFLLIFSIFYKSLKISNIYEPFSEIEKNVPVFEGKAYLFCLNQVMEMAKRFGGAKQKCLQRIRSQVAIAIVGYHG